MKRFSLIFLGALAMLMASCSKHNPQQPDPDAWVTDLSLPVPIQFGSTGVVTKAGFETIDDLNGLQIGVFGLAKHEGADWSNGSEDVLCANSSTKGIYNTVSTIIGSAIEMTGGPYYYPRLSDKNYSFYGFAPRVTGVKFSEGTLCIPGINLGLEDIIWAKAEAIGDGYNAQYIRDIKSGKVYDQEPVFNFKHVTAGLKIVAVAKTENGETNPEKINPEFENIKIKSVTVKQVHRQGKFCIAGPHESQILDLSSPDDITKNFNENLPSPKVEGATLLEIFPYPDPETDGKYKVEVQVEAPNGNYPVEFTTETLVPGSRYVYNISFSKINGVSITVGGIDWDNTHNFDVNTDEFKPEF